MSGRCCVFQPFDKEPYDKRYRDTIAPAIASTVLEPYRIDQDSGAIILIDTLHEEIVSSRLCLADISVQNPNVMYELGFAIASGKDVIIICSNHSSDKFPFDIQHRKIILYDSDSASDFVKLEKEISDRITILLRKQETKENLVTASPVKNTEGLQPNEVAALSLVMANAGSSMDTVGVYLLKRDMEEVGYTPLACRLALTQLSRMGFVEAIEETDINGNLFISYRMRASGEDWLLANRDKLELRKAINSSSPRMVSESDDLPF